MSASRMSPADMADEIQRLNRLAVRYRSRACELVKQGDTKAAAEAIDRAAEVRREAEKLEPCECGKGAKGERHVFTASPPLPRPRLVHVKASPASPTRRMPQRITQGGGAA